MDAKIHKKRTDHLSRIVDLCPHGGAKSAPTRPLFATWRSKPTIGCQRLDFNCMLVGFGYHFGDIWDLLWEFCSSGVVALRRRCTNISCIVHRNAIQIRIVLFQELFPTDTPAHGGFAERQSVMSSCFNCCVL